MLRFLKNSLYRFQLRCCLVYFLRVEPATISKLWSCRVQAGDATQVCAVGFLEDPARLVLKPVTCITLHPPPAHHEMGTEAMARQVDGCW